MKCGELSFRYFVAGLASKQVVIHAAIFVSFDLQNSDVYLSHGHSCGGYVGCTSNMWCFEGALNGLHQTSSQARSQFGVEIRILIQFELLIPSGLRKLMELVGYWLKTR